jgi:hypothetical protein
MVTFYAVIICHEKNQKNKQKIYKKTQNKKQSKKKHPIKHNNERLRKEEIQNRQFKENGKIGYTRKKVTKP